VSRKIELMTRQELRRHKDFQCYVYPTVNSRERFLNETASALPKPKSIGAVFPANWGRQGL
jgi:hypothetical protein